MNSTGIEGQLVIELTACKQSVERVTLRSTRPVSASRIFIGKTAAQTLAMMPALFSVCGVAQSRAALLAIGSALSQPVDDALERARDVLVLAENAKEHLLRIQLDWTPMFGRAVDVAQLPWISRMLTEFKNNLFENGDAFTLDSRLLSATSTAALIDQLQNYLEQHVFGCSLSAWLDIDSIDRLREWAESTDSVAAYSLHTICEQGWTTQGTGECQALNGLACNDLIACFEQPSAHDFIARPKWQGQCHETTALSRHKTHPLMRHLYQEFDASLITRWVARLVELALIPMQMRQLLLQHDTYSSPVVVASEQGVAQLEAARGRLIHRVELAHDLISQYQIVAPTEWNFHPQGVLTQSLTRIQAQNDQELEKLARMMVSVIDPCVGYELRIL